MNLPLATRFRETPRMRITRRGADGEDLLVVLGWGNKPTHEHVAWLLTRLLDAGYRVHAVTLPTNGWNFEAQYVAPLDEYLTDHDVDLALSHSTGGLVAERLADRHALRNVFLSPWWGVRTDGLVDRAILAAFERLPTAKRLYAPDLDAAAIGDLKSTAEAATGPGGLSPAFLATVREAQSRLGPFDDGDAVFYSPEDRVVDPAAIEARTPPENRRSYDGGHEFFASSGRADVLDDVLAALDAGPDAV
ncbi:alpha/beta fold hydrolase [Halobellus limi]|uniref:Alpha/beta hydrolase family protein n=2 Tax=Halobellus limi TaxID=699433 RepID=A0A1H5UCQ7_9EURY|nr:alpha/beta hydrolase [Halobellus limi]SEF72188.1 Alpha/beta hydrolase family protein [Halobellus limi]